MATTAKKRAAAPKTAKRATKAPSAKRAATAAKSAPKTAKAAKPAPKPEAASSDPFAFAAEMSPATFMLGQQDVQGYFTALGSATVEFTQANITATVEGTRELMGVKDFNEAAAIQTRLFTEGLERGTAQVMALQSLTMDAVKDAGFPLPDFKGFELPRS